MSIGTLDVPNVAPLKRLRKQELIRLLEQEQQALVNDRKARQLVVPLIQQLGLFPNGIDLVCWLDTPKARSNQSALVAWISTQLHCPDFSFQSQSTPELTLLMDRLQAKLARMEASFAL
jgi:hypothetical protein